MFDNSLSLTEHKVSLPFLQFFVLLSQHPYTLFLKTNLNIITPFKSPKWPLRALCFAIANCFWLESITSFTEASDWSV